MSGGLQCQIVCNDYFYNVGNTCLQVECPIKQRVEISGKICEMIECDGGYTQSDDGQECIEVVQDEEIPSYLQSIVDCEGEFIGKQQIYYYDTIITS